MSSFWQFDQPKLLTNSATWQLDPPTNRPLGELLGILKRRWQKSSEWTDPSSRKCEKTEAINQHPHRPLAPTSKALTSQSSSTSTSFSGTTTTSMCQVQIATRSCRLAKPASVKMSPGCKQMKVTARSAPVITIKKDAACRMVKRIVTEESGEDLDLEVNLLRHTVSEMQHQVNAAARQIQDIRSLLTQYMATQRA